LFLKQLPLEVRYLHFNHGDVPASTARYFVEGVCGRVCYLKKATKTNDNNVKTVNAPALALAA